MLKGTLIYESEILEKKNAYIVIIISPPKKKRKKKEFSNHTF